MEVNNFGVPGDMISTEEESMPSANTFTENGSIYASMSGRMQVIEGQAMVNNVRREIVSFTRGMYVLGEVTDDLHTIAFIKIADFKKGEKVYRAIKSGKIIIKNSSGPSKGRNRLENHVPTKAFGVGDILLARITFDDNDSYALDFGSSELGVVYSKCEFCDRVLTRDGNSLKCANCEQMVERKLSNLYRDSSALEEFLNKNNSI